MSSPQVLLTLSITILFSSSIIHCNDGIDLVELKVDHKTMKQKLSQFRVYWHDIQGGTSPSSITVVKNVTQTGFGMVNMIDNPLTVGPELTSKAVGRAQGFYALASQEELGLLMAMNFFFTTGKYNGSTITILGRNAVFDHVREMPVIGGSGLFRFAGGYAQARTHYLDLKTGDAIVEYTIYVLHF